MRLYIGLILGLVFSCKNVTSTPDEFINLNEKAQKSYQKDVEVLKEQIFVYYDSVNKVRKSNQMIKVLNIEIDTIFYGPDNKLSFLTVIYKENEYVKLVKPDVEVGVQYAGECYIAHKDEKGGLIRIIDRVNYSTTSKESYDVASKRLSEIYFKEMWNKHGRFNINDSRFWESNVWSHRK